VVDVDEEPLVDRTVDGDLADQLVEKRSRAYALDPEPRGKAGGQRERGTPPQAKQKEIRVGDLLSPKPERLTEEERERGQTGNRAPAPPTEKRAPCPKGPTIRS
jgi:hypothetical protein